ncbi:CCA tRNA nucleotidyltransferase, mitochondrial [Sesamum alatum]|uniref:CCA tRNA nucleotidyltransferase, mitochondrial n=1 Tax=Sesamum alatum TaxID=300844 RepID=A0AAE1Z3I5_9LAMI|nr:CCA tRNA nucleotidyltransferase, mitochondrial [Sesamum alatum]
MCISIHVKDKIDLTPKEKLIFDCLLQVVEHFNLTTQIRVAGGWVRDKLLEKECHDIDIAVDDMSGREFCEKVNEYLQSIGKKTHDIGVSPCNPDQSKHLETAVVKLFDVPVDVVNLRSEDYSENSRIPMMKFGSAEEDAYRRDLTINSLFYNINTSSVEDLTGRGIADLKSGKIATPLPPKQTFLDDPLRVLRAIRFGARFGFVLDEELKVAAADVDVKAAFEVKISRERIGKEINLMISGMQPVRAMTHISELQLFWAVFSLPPEMNTPTWESRRRLCVTYMDSAWRILHLVGHCSFNDDQQRLCLYAALLLPFRNATCRDKQDKMVPVAQYIIRDALVLESSCAKTVVSMYVAAEKLVSLIPLIMSEDGLQFTEADWKRETIDVPIASKIRILAGWVLREIKEFWRAALVISLLLYPNDVGSSNEETELKERRELFKRVENAILEKGLDKVWEMKPVVDGRGIMRVLQLDSGGPVVGEWQKKVVEWQLAHPSGSTEECTEWMRRSLAKRTRTRE